MYLFNFLCFKKGKAQYLFCLNNFFFLTLSWIIKKISLLLSILHNSGETQSYAEYSVLNAKNIWTCWGDNRLNRLRRMTPKKPFFDGETGQLPDFRT
jgi:hypothetical protein